MSHEIIEELRRDGKLPISEFRYGTEDEAVTGYTPIIDTMPDAARSSFGHMMGVLAPFAPPQSADAGIHRFGHSTAVMGAPRPNDEQVEEWANRVLEMLPHGSGFVDALRVVDEVCHDQTSGVKALVLGKAGLI